MLTPEEAAALVEGSRLFDEHWYAEQVGVAFADRAAAVEHWVTQRPRGTSPHPLVEPAWIYPGRRWRKEAPDPLSFYLDHPEDVARRSPHPRYPIDELGPLEEWLAEHRHDELPPLPVPSGDAPVVVRLDGRDLRTAVRWVRHLQRHDPDVGVVVDGLAAGGRRILAGLRATDEPEVVVEVDAGLQPPVWRWLAPLLDVVRRDGVAAAQPLLVDDQVLVAGPVGIGLPVSAVERWDGRRLPRRIPGALATRPGVEGPTVLATGSWLVAPPMEPPGEAYAGFAPAAAVLSGPPPLRWSIDIAAPAAPLGRRWGDWHFARSLADALERLGQEVVIDHPQTRHRASASADDVLLVLRGLDRVGPRPGAVNLLWVISHPDDVTPTELAQFDLAFAAGTAWAAEHGAIPLLQCTDATRFHPGVAALHDPVDEDDVGEVLFVGNARGGMRPVVAAALEAGLRPPLLTVIGGYWDRHGVPVEATGIANTELPARYARAGVVLNDHHDDMRRAGFVSNRVFDVLAVGGRLLGDDVAGLADVLGVDLPVWRAPDDVVDLALPPYDRFGTAAERRALAERVVAEHSFDARAATLLDAARRLVDSRG